MIKSLILITTAIFLLGCATPNSALYPGHSYAPTSPKSVQIYEAFPPDKNSYEVIGEVRFDGDVVEIVPSFVNEKFRIEAAKRGADAIVIERLNSGMIVQQVPGTITTTPGYYSTTSTYTAPSYTGQRLTKIRGLLLKFKS